MWTPAFALHGFQQIIDLFHDNDNKSHVKLYAEFALLPIKKDQKSWLRSGLFRFGKISYIARAKLRLLIESNIPLNSKNVKREVKQLRAITHSIGTDFHFGIFWMRNNVWRFSYLEMMPSSISLKGLLHVV